MEVLSYADLHTIYLFIFSLGLGLGLGATILANALFLFAASDKRISQDEFNLIKKARSAIWAAILLYGFGGLGLFTLAYESMLTLGIFYASMVIVLILVVNELAFSFYHIPRLRDKGTILNVYVLVGGVVAVVSWIFLTLHHTMYRTNIDFFSFLALYIGALLFGILAIWFMRKGTLTDKGTTLISAAVAVTFVTGAIFGVVGFSIDNYMDVKEVELMSEKNTGEKQRKENTYTVDDVALHDNDEDCWLIIDTKVFNATEAARLHPAMFNCGEDVTENYHKNHGGTIRDKMMKFYIGELVEGEGITNVDFPFEKAETLTPYRELYVEEGSWDPHTLMLVVEKDAEKLLAIDGTTHKKIGRVHDVGFQPHTSVFSSDAKYMFIISRDGWLTKINIQTLEPVMSVSVGVNSRGTALTDDGKYVAIGNYEPGNLVLLTADTLDIVKTIPLVMEIDGKMVESRAGAVVEDGNSIIVALKDATSVWTIDTEKEGFPVTHKFNGIGGGEPALHDAFLTPDGAYYIVASQGSKTAWILDLHTMKKVAEITTGETPHTGPGAAWGNFIYVPALGEGLITAIDTSNWENTQYIKTGGPGLFVRSYSKDPSYPYVWADTAFGDNHDEIYVIDARINKVIKTIVPVEGESSWHPEFTYDGKFVYIVSQTANEVEVYDAYTFELVKRIEANTPSAISNVGLRIEEPGL